MKILLVEDESATRLMLEAMLVSMKYEVTVAADGREAWQLFQEQRFPLVITDWLMPEMDGLALCRAIRELSRDQYTMILLITGLAGKEDYLEAMAAGVDDFIAKPIDEDRLRAKLKVIERILGIMRG